MCASPPGSPDALVGSHVPAVAARGARRSARCAGARRRAGARARNADRQAAETGRHGDRRRLPAAGADGARGHDEGASPSPTSTSKPTSARRTTTRTVSPTAPGSPISAIAYEITKAGSAQKITGDADADGGERRPALRRQREARRTRQVHAQAVRSRRLARRRMPTSAGTPTRRPASARGSSRSRSSTSSPMPASARKAATEMTTSQSGHRRSRIRRAPRSSLPPSTRARPSPTPRTSSSSSSSPRATANSSR